MNMFNRFCIVISIQLFNILISRFLFAQPIQTDGTTPLTTPGNCFSSCTISGGVRHGQNIFHSFSRFNVDVDQTVLFSDPGVTNILSRVTGTSQSNILGVLGVTGGDANLFLINPNGIIFGPNSSLSTGGSFVATTANAIQFDDRGLFSASIQKIPLLTINPSALVFNKKTSSIVNRSISPAQTNLSNKDLFGLKVPDNKSLLLVGGDIIIDGGGLYSFDGRLELGGLAESGTINLDFTEDSFSLEFPKDRVLSNTSIVNEASLNATGTSGGNIAINASNLNVQNKSKISSGIVKNTAISNSKPGNISITATDNITLSASNISNKVMNGGIGNGGNIYISAQNIVSSNNQVDTDTLGKGDAGNIFIQAKDRIFLTSNSRIFSNIESKIENGTLKEIGIGDGGDINLSAREIFLEDFSRIATFGFGLGEVGEITLKASQSITLTSDSRVGSSIVGKDRSDLSKNSDPSIQSDILSALNDTETLKAINTPSIITISSQSLSINDGGQIANFATGTGIGKGGNIAINSTDFVNISGSSRGTEFSKLFGLNNGTGFSSGLFTFARESTTGPAGNITVKTGDLLISDGGAISTQTFNASQGGDITLLARNFSAINGGQVRTTASSSGNAGDITLKATENIKLSGSEPNFEERLATLQIGLELIELISLEQARGEIGLLREIGPKSGLFANTTRDSIGTGGNINIDPELVLIGNGASIAVNSAGKGQAGNIALRSDDLTLDRGTITARSNSDAGGNISLSIADTLLLRDNSQISTTASGKGTGGKININADFIITAPTENNDVTANALNGPGGQITINTKGIVGLEVREQNTNFSDITAISQNNPQLNGTVNINTPETDPSDNLSEQPETVAPPQDIAQGCRPGQALGGSTFVNIGRGGLPQGPQEAQTPPSLWQDLRAHNLQTSATAAPTSLAPPPEIVEAKGWAKDTQGRIYLTASAPQPSPNPSQPTPTC